MSTATSQAEQQGPLRQFLGIVRELAEASLVVIGFACVILVLGLPVALAVRGLHDIVLWFVGSL
jgi:hypothetical protein